MNRQQLDEERVFHTARGIPNPEIQSDYLDQICADDPALRERVEALLEVHEKEQDFLKASPEPEPTVDHTSLTERPGITIGRYKLLQKIGEGGFGVVYMAKQQLPVRRKVALKIIKPGMDTKEVIARFEAERQALALMDHPNISRVLDGGTTESGRPYFVMELVRGVPITEYCDNNELSTRDRLRLFVTACRAVQHAHQKGIIHRDLKPTNILVTLHDGEPVIQVIDFGVAKAINQQLTEKTLFTTFGQMVGTPQYMSPEQAEMSGLDVDTRSDVYSLGVLLYELLTGATPLQAERLRTAGYAEMQRMIREEEPPKPSTRLSGSSDRLTTIARHRSATPELLLRQVQGDLDWIVMKCLEKDRSLRYDTTNSLADDVQRYLIDEPVSARSPSAVYWFGKFARRNRVVLTTTAIIAASLILGIVGTSWLAVALAKSLEREQEERRQAQHTLSKLHGLLIELAMLQGFAGDTAEVQETLRLAEDAEVSQDWLLTLEGCAALHRGAVDRARSLLQQAVAAEPSNVSAHAMLSVAHVWNGDWESWSLLIEDLLPMQARPRYHDFDSLFSAYADFYRDHEAAARELELLLADKRTWIVPRAIMATAWGHAAGVHHNSEYAVEALHKLRGPALMASDNPIVLVVSLGVFIPYLLVLEEEQPDVRQEADNIAAKLSNYPQNAVTAHMRAVYYQAINDRTRQQDALKDVLRYGSGFFLEEAMAAMYEFGDVEGLLRVEEKGVEAKTAKAYILAESSRQDDRDRAYSIFCELNEQHSTWYVRHKLLQLLLLLRKTDLAQKVCSEWLWSSNGVEHFGNWERKSIEYVAGNGNRTGSEFVALDSDPVGQFFVNYQHAFLAMSEGKRETALKHFRAASEWHYPDERRQWARAFAARLSQELEGSGEHSVAR